MLPTSRAARRHPWALIVGYSLLLGTGLVWLLKMDDPPWAMVAAGACGCGLLYWWRATTRSGRQAGNWLTDRSGVRWPLVVVGTLLLLHAVGMVTGAPVFDFLIAISVGGLFSAVFISGFALLMRRN